MRKLNIVQMIPRLVTGGAETLLVQLCLALKQQHNVTVVCQYPAEGNPYEALLAEQGVPVIYLNKKVGFDLANLREVTRVMKRLKPDVIHTHLDSCKYLLGYYMGKRRCAKIHTVHTTALLEFDQIHPSSPGSEHGGGGKIHREIMKFMYRFQGVTPVAICPAVRDSIAAEYGLSDIPMIFNGIDTEKFSNPGKSFAGAPRIVNVASFSKVKNQALLVEAFRLAQQEKPELELVFVGDGVERPRVEALAAGLEHVRFAGISSDVAGYLHEARVFCLCSTYEGLPLSVLEAYAAGLPVVATDVGGVRDILTDGENGFLIESGNPQALKDALLTLAADPALCRRMGAANIKKARAFDIHAIGEEYTALYLSRLGEK